MRKITRKALTATAVAATTVGLTAVPALASGTWTVSPGGAVTGVNTTALRAVDMTTGAPVICNVSNATGSVAGGTGLSGTDIAQLDSVSFSTPTNPNGWCTGPVGIVVQVTAQNLPWKFSADSYDAGTGVTIGRLTGIKATIHGSDECDATITGPGGAAGEISGTHTNPANAGDPSLLQVSGNNLEVTAVDADCDPTLIGVGDQVALAGQYALNPGQTITSP